MIHNILYLYQLGSNINYENCQKNGIVRITMKRICVATSVRQAIISVQNGVVKSFAAYVVWITYWKLKYKFIRPLLRSSFDFFIPCEIYGNTRLNVHEIYKGTSCILYTRNLNVFLQTTFSPKISYSKLEMYETITLPVLYGCKTWVFLPNRKTETGVHL